MKVREKFAELKIKQEKALLAFLPGNYPTPEDFLTAAEAVLDGGADILEIGIPFSDPLADGPIIAEAYHKLVEQKENLERILVNVKVLSLKYPHKAFVIMSYANPLIAKGVRGGEAMLDAGVSAVIVPDIPFEEKALLESMLPEGIDVVAMLAPTTSCARRDYILKEAKSFIYCVALTGVTGERNTFQEREVSFLGDLHGPVDIPMVIGFGISSPEQAKAASCFADGIVIGSKLTRLASDPRALKTFVQEVKAALITR